MLSRSRPQGWAFVAAWIGLTLALGGCAPTQYFVGTSRSSDEVARVVLHSSIKLVNVKPVGTVKGFDRHWGIGSPHDLRDQVFLPGRYEFSFRQEERESPGPGDTALSVFLFLLTEGQPEEAFGLPADPTWCANYRVQLDLRPGHKYGAYGEYLVDRNSATDVCWYWIVDENTNEVVAGVDPSRLDEITKKVAKEGHAPSQYALGQAHYRLRSLDEAWKWNCYAANNGHASARLWLAEGYLFERQPVARDLIKALMWHVLGTKSGQSEANTTRDRIIGDMSPEQIAEAERMAAEWEPDLADCETGPGAYSGS